MTQTKWFKGSVQYRGALDLDDFAALIMHAGAQAVNITGKEALEFYLQGTEQELQAFTKQQIFSDCLSVNLIEVPDENWVQKCGELFAPVQCGQISIVPLISAEERSKYNDDSALYLIPGMGFGSGHHPTSQMIMQFMQGLDIKPESILDCGTGSGILSIAAAKLFPAKIHAFDNDPQAIINASENFSLNSLSRINLTLNSVENLTGTYDLILANLYLELLKKFKPDFQRMMHKSSTLLISGITADQAEELLEHYQDMKLLDAKNINGWSGFKFGKG